MQAGIKENEQAYHAPKAHWPALSGYYFNRRQRQTYAQKSQGPIAKGEMQGFYGISAQSIVNCIIDQQAKRQQTQRKNDYFYAHLAFSAR